MWRRRIQMFLERFKARRAQMETTGRLEAAPRGADIPVCGLTGDGSPHRPRRHCAFTLMELLVVIGIMALIATLVAPSVGRMRRVDLVGAANRQLLDDLAEARRQAIANRTTVYVVFMPPADPNFDASAELTLEDRTTILANQQTAYAMFLRRSAGDQPGREYPRYLGPWRTLPQGVFIPGYKFQNRGAISNPATPFNFLYGTDIPLPRPRTNVVTKVPVPYIAFDYLGRLVSDAKDEVIPLLQGAVEPKLDNSQNLLWQPATEAFAANAYTNHVRIDWLTGRPSLERPEIQ